jgi:hypothetical protein
MAPAFMLFRNLAKEIKLIASRTMKNNRVLNRVGFQF